jgi:hypothetical protein
MSDGRKDGAGGNKPDNEIDDWYFGYGDVVEHRMNTDVFGVVIGLEGSLVHVRLSPSLAVAKYHDCELRPIEDDEYREPEGGNVVRVDFTKREKLETAKPRGAA